MKAANKAVDFAKLKKKLSAEFHLPLPANADLRERYEKMLKEKNIPRNEKFEKVLLSRKIRTRSGVAVVAVLTKPYPCPGKCLYCPGEKGMPKSYLSNEPAVMRAISMKFNPYRQVQNRLASLSFNGHSTDKIELIVMGGTFSYLPKNYQKKFIAECFRAANEFGNKNYNRYNRYNFYNQLKRNENAKHRIVGLTLETRPDYVDEKEIVNFRELGCTRVELGVQNIFDPILKLNNRGHNVSETVKATRTLKDAGFKINYHIMPGLPGSTPERDLDMFKSLFESPLFQPDMLKIYPAVVLKDSPLYHTWLEKKYSPMTNSELERLILRIKNEVIPPYVRINRLIRDVPTTSVIAGPTISNLRQKIAEKSRCRCIRCREVGMHYDIKEKIMLHRIDYAASDGKEIFLEFVSSDKNKLFALLRLRIPSFQENNISVLKNAAIIREVHTYGQVAPLNTRGKSSPQHMGLGKKLMQEAERITRKEFGIKKIAVISGIGARQYYRKLGYRLKDTYMVKQL